MPQVKFSEKPGEKTNVMRILDAKKVHYDGYVYECDTVPSGKEIAEILGHDPQKVFKTLVTVAKSGEHYVFVIPVNEELDLKKAASAVNEKNIEMLPQKDLLPLTGYIHGGCSPIGMKKFYKTTFDLSAEHLDLLTFSAGKVGCQVRLSPEDLKKVIPFRYAPICKEKSGE